MRPRDSKGRFVAKNNDATSNVPDPIANEAGNYELVLKIPGFYNILIWLVFIFILSPWLLSIYQPICNLFKFLGFINNNIQQQPQQGL